MLKPPALLTVLFCSCHIGRFTPSKRVTEFRMTAKGRVGTISVRYVSD